LFSISVIDKPMISSPMILYLEPFQNQTLADYANCILPWNKLQIKLKFRSWPILLNNSFEIWSCKWYNIECRTSCGH
jgi:hypothetical protein